MRRATLALVLCSVAAPATAVAQVAFPPDSSYVPLRCGDANMFDRFQDQAGAFEARDLVGDQEAPAGLRAADDTHLFLRMRLEEDPAPNAAVQPYAWGMLFDLDGDRATYELMVHVEGIAGEAGTVSLYRNTVTTLRNDPNDPVDLPAVATYPFAMNARTRLAAGSSYGVDDDFFLDFAIPWSELVPLGLDRTTPVRVWVATSSAADHLNSDFACHDGAGGGAVRLDGTASDPTTGDPGEDPNGGGGGVGRLEGGGGCSATGGGAGALAPLALLAMVAGLARRGRRGQARRGGA